MSKNPIESAVLSNVKVDYAKGSLSLTDPFTQLPRRVGIVDMPFISRLQSLLWAQNKDKAVDPKLFFYEFGRSWGFEFYKNLNERIQQIKSESIRKPQDYLKDEFIEYLNNYLSYSGIGQFRITEGNKFYVIELKHSVEWALEKIDGDHMNRILAGFLSALFSSISGKRLSCTGFTDTHSPERNRFALSTEDVIEEIEQHLQSGKTEKDILAAYGNQHLE